METESTHAACAPKPSPRERGQTLVDAWRRSGLSQRAFAKQQQVQPHLVSYWARQFPPSRSGTSAAPVAAAAITDFVEVSAPSRASSPSRIAPNGSPLEILLGCGAVVRVVPGVDPALLRIVVSALAGERC